jgi:hypothetical protein
MWQQSANSFYQLWVWLTYEASVHPFILLGVVLIIVSAWVMYKTEVRTK